MARAFEGTINVHYGQAYVGNRSDALAEDVPGCFRGQANGLCGAAEPGKLFLVTGLHTGSVGFTVDVLDAPPPLDDTWEEIVEVTFLVVTTATDIVLMEWGGSGAHPIPLQPGTYRARYCAKGMDLGKEQDTLMDEEPVDFYALYFWPAAAAEDRIIKQTSEVAAYWHSAWGSAGTPTP
jgi:hypothetical protein